MFHEIDITTWPRAQVYYYFSQMAPTGYSISVELDVTKLLKTLKENAYKFFPAYLWLVTKNLNRQIEFKCALKDGKIGYYDELTPFYAQWHDDDKTFSCMWTAYSDSFPEFHKAYLSNQKNFGDNHGFLSRPELPPENCYTVSAVPWVNFTHFAVHNFDNRNYFFPSVEAGKYIEKDSRVMMPLSMTCHHGATDGYHISEFLKALQHDMDNFSDFI